MNKYKIGDKVRIKSIEWYNQNKEEHGLIINDAEESNVFCSGMSPYCGRELTVKAILKSNESWKKFINILLH